MHCSIVMPVYNRPDALNTVLESIRLQRPQLRVGKILTRMEYEVIVCNDGPLKSEIKTVCKAHDVDQFFDSRNSRYRNPATAWNMGYRAAKGDVIISQGADVMHAGQHTIRALYENMALKRYVVATVFNVRGKRHWITRVYTAPDRKRVYGGLQAIWRKDIYEIGGLEETIPEAGWDDNYRSACLEARGVMPFYTTEAVGFHLDHSRSQQTDETLKAAENVYRQRLVECERQGIPPTASGGPWEWNE